MLDRKGLDCLEELLAEKRMLKEILVKTKKEKKSTVLKAFRACMYHREQKVAISMTVKQAFGEVSEGNENMLRKLEER